ncbi:tyrosine-protein phosphatase [Arthrobacter sp. NPDC080031]|uniref:tyrosine-protein phosphatase n=1 Tax=Arthrobacter sp. NPDC080031 TaxID=3155918 RepID=UPI00344E0B0E
MTTTAEDAVFGTRNRPYPVEGTYNFRSTAGYAAAAQAEAAAGRTVREGKLYRSDALHGLTDAGRRQFSELGIRLVIDLRDRTELKKSPSKLDGLGVDTRHNPIFEEGNVPGTAEITTLLDIYRLMVRSHAQRLADAVRLIADSGTEPVLVHCTAGKDRTGVVIALALLAAGVDREQVVLDYVASEENLRGEWSEAMMAAVGSHPGIGAVGEELRGIISASPAAVLEATLDLVDEMYGGAAGLLQAHDFSDADLERLRDVLTINTNR